MEDSLVRRITSAQIRVEIDEENKSEGEENNKESFIGRNFEDDSGNIEEIWKNIGTLLLKFKYIMKFNRLNNFLKFYINFSSW